MPFNVIFLRPPIHACNLPQHILEGKDIETISGRGGAYSKRNSNGEYSQTDCCFGIVTKADHHSRNKSNTIVFELPSESLLEALLAEEAEAVRRVEDKLKALDAPKFVTDTAPSSTQSNRNSSSSERERRLSVSVVGLNPTLPVRSSLHSQPETLQNLVAKTKLMVTCFIKLGTFTGSLQIDC